MNVEFSGKSIIINDNPVQIISGAMHYFRVHPALWDDRLAKAAAMGLNCIETYTPWNLHEPHEGEFNFNDGLNVATYLRKIAEHGMYAIVRPGPYICAEWDNGGLPAWLLSKSGMEIRRMNEPYLNSAKKYLTKVLDQVKNANNLIMVQVENEYGSFGEDSEYLVVLRDFYRQCGINVPLFTSDGANRVMLNGGTLSDCLATVNFGSKAAESFAIKHDFRNNEPDFCMEFWNGWFDHWGVPHHLRAAKEAAKELKDILEAGANVNLYMFHGGTNFGFTNGANGHPGCDYASTVTSYDYDAPLSESGDLTEKYFEFKKIISAHTGKSNAIEVSDSAKFVPAEIKLTESAALLENLDNLSKPLYSVTPKTMEELGENFGFIYYRKELKTPFNTTNLRLLQLNDRAQIWLNREYLGSRFRENGNNPIELPEQNQQAMLEILAENCGRINYGPSTGRDFKGIVDGVALDLQMQFHWENRTLPLNDLSKLVFKNFNNSKAMFHRGQFILDNIADTFIMRPGEKGVIWVNGFNLGRYWNVGPTQTLYLPAPILKNGSNEIIVLELEKLDSDQISFSHDPIL